MLDNYNSLIENAITKLLDPFDCEYRKLLDAGYYSISAGGKRIRPKLLLEFMRISGGEPEFAVNFAVALEMIHTYSLIHDDLPCMDNDDMRRGRPSCHKAFGEDTALLAGDSLLTNAFSVALSTFNIPYERIVKAAKLLAQCAGTHGMIAGQVIDLKYEGQKPSKEVILELYRLKTGALLKAGAAIGCILAGADGSKIQAASDFAENLGLAFQIRDDILDIVGDEETLGKPIGSDNESGKYTYVSAVGLEQALKDVDMYTSEALKALEVFGSEADGLKALSLQLAGRNN